MIPSFETNIKQYNFNDNGINSIKKEKYGIDWPVVYILSSSKEAYIGETQNAYGRMVQHKKNPCRYTLTKVSLITSETFNKSAILDIENMLITYMHADGVFSLQNANGGQSKLHNYYQRAFYQEFFKKIWSELARLKIAKHSLLEIQNSDIFKYSPFKMLTDEQYQIVESLLYDFSACISKKERQDFVINGGAGTGKTLIAIYFLNMLMNIIKSNVDTNDLDEEADIYNLKVNIFNTIKDIGRISIGFVVSVPSFKRTIKKIFSGIDALKKIDVLSPTDASKKDYDILIVDEAHRLKRRKKLTNYAAFDKVNYSLGLSNDANELDWLKLRAKKMLILFYDKNQSVKEADIDAKCFNNYVEHAKNYYLNSQLRIQGGNEYIEFINALFSKKPSKYQAKEGYDFRIYDDCRQMFDDIKEKNNSCKGLCRMLAGLSFYWRKRRGDSSSTNYDQDYDFIIDGHKYCWNKDFNDDNFIINDKYIDTIGCIYTSQGHDLNYAGVILGNDIKYNPITKTIEYDIKNFFDANSKSDDINKTVLNIVNAYKVLLTRGVYGTYVYACDKNLNEYLKSLAK